jgi:hypothetical protein
MKLSRRTEGSNPIFSGVTHPGRQQYRTDCVTTVRVKTVRHHGAKESAAVEIQPVFVERSRPAFSSADSGGGDDGWAVRILRNILSSPRFDEETRLGILGLSSLSCSGAH